MYLSISLRFIVKLVETVENRFKRSIFLRSNNNQRSKRRWRCGAEGKKKKEKKENGADLLFIDAIES